MPIDKFTKGTGGPIKPADARPKKGVIKMPSQPSNNDLSGSEKGGPQDIK